MVCGILGVVLGLFVFAAAQDCSSLLSGSGKKRFVFDDVANYFNQFPKEIQALLPRNSEVDSKCRFDLTNLQDSQRATLKSLRSQGYTICVGCGYQNSDHGRCHSIDVCAKGSRCISGKNEQRAPTYYWHACCDPSDPECRTRTEKVTFHLPNNYNPSLNYIMAECNSPLCNENGYTQQKNDLIQYLTNSSPVTTAPVTSAPVTSAPVTSAPVTSAPVTSAPVTQAQGPVDGGWTQWSTLGSCDKSCDIGTRYRTRACTQPIPQNGGEQCPGISKEVDICNAFACP